MTTERETLEAALQDARKVVKAVAAGDLDCRVDSPYSEGHPMGALAVGINSMIDALRDARADADAGLQELEVQISTIEAQREAIRELSTPIIEVWRGVLCMPVVGVLDSMRAADITNELLHAIVERKADYVIIDITGIEVMDSNTTDHFMRLAKAVTLLGAQCVLSGVNPNVAQTVVQMGIDLTAVRSHRSLRDALRAYVRSTSGDPNGEGRDPAETV